jgi:biotin carboxyl carrier protein
MKLNLRVGANEFPINLKRKADRVEGCIGGTDRSEFSMSVVEAQPGVFSVLAGTRSHTVRVNRSAEGFEVRVGAQRVFITVSDPRDVSSASKNVAHRGPQEIRALMPGKVVKLLAELDDDIAAGAGILVVEAMKMQNEMKAPRNGRITRIFVREGATVGAGQPLVVLE